MREDLQWTLPYVRWREPRSMAAGEREPSRQCHDHLFLLFTEGAGFVTVNGKTLEAIPGRLFYILPSWWYSYGTGENTPLKFFSVHFDWVEREDSPRTDPFNTPTGLPPQPVFPIPGWEVNTTPWLDLHGQDELFRAFEALNSLRFNGDRRSPTEIQASGWLLVLLGRLMAVTPQAEPVLNHHLSPATLRRLAKARHRLENSQELLSPSQIARESGWTPDHFRRLCREAYGHTPTELQTKARLQRAKRLLQHGATSAEAARQCGFATASYFARLYRREFGVSPGEDRQVRTP